VVGDKVVYLEDYLRRSRPSNGNTDNTSSSIGDIQAPVVSHTAGYYTEEQARNSKHSFLIDFYQSITNRPELSDIIIDRVGFQLYRERYFIRENFQRFLIKEIDLKIDKPEELPSQLAEFKKYIKMQKPQDGPRTYTFRCQKDGLMYNYNFEVTLKKQSLWETLQLRRILIDE
jgi:hypothetical protein